MFHTCPSNSQPKILKILKKYISQIKDRILDNKMHRNLAMRTLFET